MHGLFRITQGRFSLSNSGQKALYDLGHSELPALIEFTFNGLALRRVRLVSRLPASLRMPSELSELAALITSSVSAIETACEAQGIEVPSLNSIFDPAHDRAFQSASVIVDAVKTVVAATHQLNAILQSPYATLCNVALSVNDIPTI